MENSDNKIKVIKFYDEIDKCSALCQSCGMCQGVCPVGAIKMKQNEFSQFVPEFDSSKCIGCTQCINSCIVRKNQSKEKTVIGSYYNIYIAKSNNERDVVEGSSGGVATALLRYGLEKGTFDEVLSVKNQESTVVATPVYTKSANELSSSKYISAPLCTIYDKKRKNLAVTALPCQAKAIRKQSEDTFIVGLFCSKLSLEDLIKYIIKNNKCENLEIKKVEFRRGCWPGKFIITFKNSDRKIEETLNRSMFNSVYNSYNFSGSGCLVCDDYFSEKSDISVGDPWGIRKQYNEGYNGETIVITRTKRGDELVSDAIGEGIIIADKIDVSEVVRGHLKEIYNKKTAIKQRMDILSKKTDALSGYNREILIDGKNFSILNKYAIHNNWNRRFKSKKYNKIFKKSPKMMFVTRFVHAYLLTRRLKKSNNCSKYLEIARQENIQ